MQKNSIRQDQLLKQKLSQQNILLFKMMELNSMQFDQKVKEELEVNPALENIDNFDTKSLDSYYQSSDNDSNQESFTSNPTLDLVGRQNQKEITLESSNYDQNREYSDYSFSKNDQEDKDFYIPVVDNDSLMTSLQSQLKYSDLSDDQLLIGEYLIGNIDDDGYLRRSIESIVDDLQFRQNFLTTEADVQEVLESIQELDPPGIAAQSLQECLMIQLKRKKYTKEIKLALDIVTDYFESFTKKQYDRLMKKFHLNSEELQAIVKIITSLNPKPTFKSNYESELGKFITPDFILFRNENKLELELHTYNKPNLIISQDFVEMLKKIKAEKKKNAQSKEAQDYVSDKISKANMFLSLIKERHETMVIIMNTIMNLQKDFFLQGDEKMLKPMALKHIAAITHFDISTISRVTNSKYVQTEFGIFSLKFFFSESISTEEGEVSNRLIMKTIEKMIENEDKYAPLSDDQITINLEKLGYKIARRTTAKYRENLKIQPKHHRKLK